MSESKKRKLIDQLTAFIGMWDEADIRYILSQTLNNPTEDEIKPFLERDNREAFQDVVASEQERHGHQGQSEIASEESQEEDYDTQPSLPTLPMPEEEEEAFPALPKTPGSKINFDQFGGMNVEGSEQSEGSEGAEGTEDLTDEELQKRELLAQRLREHDERLDMMKAVVEELSSSDRSIRECEEAKKHLQAELNNLGVSAKTPAASASSRLLSRPLSTSAAVSSRPESSKISQKALPCVKRMTQAGCLKKDIRTPCRWDTNTSECMTNNAYLTKYPGTASTVSARTSAVSAASARTAPKLPSAISARALASAKPSTTSKVSHMQTARLALAPSVPNDVEQQIRQLKSGLKDPKKRYLMDLTKSIAGSRGLQAFNIWVKQNFEGKTIGDLRTAEYDDILDMVPRGEIEDIIEQNLPLVG